MHYANELFSDIRSMLIYLCLFVCLVYFVRPWFSYKAFLSIGPITVAPDTGLSFHLRCLSFLLAGFGGAHHLLRNDRPTGFAEASLAAAISVTAAVGIYLLCYTLHNAIFRAVFALALATTVALAVLDWRTAKDRGLAWSSFNGLVRPLWLLMFGAGLVTCLFPGWALTAESYTLQMPEEREQRTLAANIDTAAKFFTEEWRDESLAEKAVDAGAIVIVEANYYGVNGPAEIAVSACPETSVASYDARENRITLNTAYLATECGFDCIKSAAHETAHAFEWQACTGQILPDIETGWPGGFPDEDVLELWRHEMNFYVSAAFDAEEYYSQAIEQAAYSGGWAAAKEIESRVEKYLATGNPEP